MKRGMGAVLSLSVALVASSGAALAADLILAHHDTMASINTEFANKFISCVQGKVGDIKINHVPAAQMGDARQILEQIKMGAVQMTVTDMANLTPLEPTLGVITWPYMFLGFDHAEKAFSGKVGEYVSDALSKKHGMKVIGYLHNGFRDFESVRPVKTVADMKGMKFRSPPLAAWLEMYKSLGAVAVPVPWPEVYTALQTKVAEGVDTSPEGVVNAKLDEVVKYLLKSGHMYNSMALVIKDQTFQKFPEPTKQAFVACGADFTKAGNAEFRARTEASYKLLQSKGVTISEADKLAFKAATQPAIDALKKATPGADVMIKLIDESR